MSDPFILEVAKSLGPAGLSLVAAYLYIKQMHKEYVELSQKRVEDHQAMVGKLLELNDKWNEAINSQSDLIAVQQEFQEEVTELVRELKNSRDRNRSRY